MNMWLRCHPISTNNINDGNRKQTLVWPRQQDEATGEKPKWKSLTEKRYELTNIIKQGPYSHNQTDRNARPM